MNLKTWQDVLDMQKRARGRGYKNGKQKDKID